MSRQYEEGKSCAWDLERQNYLSAQTRAKEVQEQFEEEEKLGPMMRLSLPEAKAKLWDRLAVAALSAIQKKNGACRVVHDGTRGIGINRVIKNRGQLATPAAGEVKTILQTLPGCYFGLFGDVARANRLVKVAEIDWGFLTCRSGVGEDLWFNKMGSFSISRAAYHWARLMMSISRRVYYLLGDAEFSWLVYVDDLLWFVRDSRGVELVILFIYFLEVLGLLFAWKKFEGGIDVAWVGFEICLKGARLGLSEILDLAAVLGRLSFGLTALWHVRPFLGPIAMSGLGECKVPKL